MSEQIPAGLAEDLRGFDVREVVQLFTIDATVLGGDLMRFSPAPVETSGVHAPVLFDGDLYAVIPMESDGWEWTSQGAPPTPRF